MDSIVKVSGLRIIFTASVVFLVLAQFSALRKLLKIENYAGDALTNPRVIQGSSVSSSIAESNSSEYTWIGNHFVPPEGVPTFHPNDFVSYFSGRNTLFIGDSLARRAYGTLFGIMNSTDNSNIYVYDVDAANKIDFGRGKRGRVVYCDDQERQLMKLNAEVFSCNTLVNHFDLSLKDARNIAETIAKETNKAKFDYVGLPCARHILEAFFDETALNMTASEIFRDYDLIVVSLGIWEGVRRWICLGPKPTLSTEAGFDLMLRKFVNLSSSNLQIAFRTPGFNVDHAGDNFMLPFGNQIHALSGDHGDDRNITIVDWGAVISKRSYGEERIAGDNPSHYGLEARLLFAQQLLHELLASEHK